MTSPLDLVRVRQDNGHEFTTSRAVATSQEGLSIQSGKDAVDVNGQPLPPKFNLPPAQFTKQTSGKQAAVKEA